MTALFGAAGCNDEIVDEFLSHCLDIWPGAKFVQSVSGCLIGARAYQNLAAIYPSLDGDIVGVQGEAHVYLPDVSGTTQEAPVEHAPTGTQVRDGLAANFAKLSRDGCLQLRCHESGIFPLYFLLVGDGVLYSSHIRPLARVLSNAELDFVGITQFLGEGHTFSGRTPYSGIRRMLAGQELSLDVSGQIKVIETSQLWQGPIRADISEVEAAEEFWSLLVSEVQQDRSIEQGDLTLMMSAGWDSRTLLAAYLSDKAGGSSLQAYFHGDTASREHRIVEAICSDHDISLQTMGLDRELLSLEFLQHNFQITENLIFPHWHRAGNIASGSGPVSAGIYGEIPGGHFGNIQLGRTSERMLALAAKVFNLNSTDQGLSDEGIAAVRAKLHWSSSMFYWYLDSDVRRQMESFQHITNSDIDADLGRLQQRGVQTIEQLVEAFISEHRGAYYVAAQLLSVGHDRGIVTPFARSKLLRRMTQLPMFVRVHNKANRIALQRHMSQLNNYPSAATLVALKHPLLLQEVSRVFRKLYEVGMSKAGRLTRGMVSKPTMEWVNFEFLLRETHLFRDLVDDLQSDIWNKKDLHKMIDRIDAGSWEESGHNVYDQLNKIYTIDMLLRDRP